MIDPTGAVRTDANPFVTTAMPQAAPDRPWQGLPGRGLLEMLGRMQTERPDMFQQLIGKFGEKFGITPDNLGTMQSRQDVRQQYRQPGGFNNGAGMQPPQQPALVSAMPAPMAATSGLPAPAPAAPLAPVTTAVMPQGFGGGGGGAGGLGRPGSWGSPGAMGMNGWGGGWGAWPGMNNASRSVWEG